MLGKRILVVLGGYADQIQTAIDFGNVTSIVNPDWQEGMASSIRAGVQALPASAAAVLILLRDQTLVNAVHIQDLLHGWQQAPNHIVASQYHHSVSVPALFAAELFTHLLTFRGGLGTKPLLIKFADRRGVAIFAKACFGSPNP